ncbi:IS3 family transposase [Vibrio parahaemolyticus]|uniref:IS3 family transposase n=2 Tax=Vibrio parahaemolyticus TaxID=670 RepID=UPI0009A9DE7D|nr:IS3 family transposase [Vibrio parahaemolyticus]EGQ8047408.1 IS3 family transposase [Vibrio parahaemolyticus]EHH2868062.1 IS3 family transposase [Vibrio parahaemolyticus]ELA9315686.1 IS3 family transposase [Vibrio parahaemolyticus]MBM5036048.1 IS3 family transposase [Vibrio parahaemolyticus]MBM5049203.1 IS3 family transposase [Vibrio parahaemolyticus]
MAKHRNPAYTAEFRKEAVRLASLPGRTAVSVAKELGISAQQIRNWKRQFTRLSDKQFNTLDGVDYSKKESEELRALRRENKRLKDEMEFLKKGLGVLREAARVKYEFIESYTGEYSISLMCRTLEVSRGGYYKWCHHTPSERSKRRERFEQLVMCTFAQYRARYGSVRIAEELNEAGYACCVNYVADIMKEKGIRARNGKGFKYSKDVAAMTNVADNLLRRDFESETPNQKWVTDITYIWVKSRWLFLATVMDLHSRRIVGWSLGLTMTVELITNALKMAFESRKPPKGVIIHSDGGVQYGAYKYQDFMRKHGGVPSMNRQGNCWDNAVMESFYSRLKVELIYAEDYQTVEEARMGIFEYIEVFYNRRRRHSALGACQPG